MSNVSGITVVSSGGSDQEGATVEADGARASRLAGASRRKRRAGARADDPTEPSRDAWKGHDPKTIARFYAQTYSDFFGIVGDYLDQSNQAAKLYKSSLLSHRRWRLSIITATGILALINVGAALDVSKTTIWGGISLPTALNALAALLAACLTVAGNVASFLNGDDQAAKFRDTRDLLLSQYREYCAKWVCGVEAHGRTPTALMNAGRLYSELVESDHELRQKLKQLEQVKPRETVPGGRKG